MSKLPIVDDLRRLVEAGSGTEEQENMAAAADVIEALSAELETVKGELETREAEIAEWEHTSKRWDEWAKDRADRLAAAEAKLAGGEAVKVKPLEWEEIHQRRSDEDPSTEVVGFEAPTGFSEWYSIDTRVADFVLHLPDSDGSTSLHETEREAKAAAQADYERRIMAALIHPAPTHNDGSGEACIPRSVSDAELSQWAEKRADDAGRLARELLAYRRASLTPDVINLVTTALEHASFALDGVVALDDEDEGKDGGSETCQHTKRTVDRALAAIRALASGGKQ